MKDLGKTVFGRVLVDRTRRNAQFVFYLSFAGACECSLQRGQIYALLQKQPGAKQRLTVNLRLGKKLIAATPKEAVAYYEDDRYHATFALSKDTLIETQVEH